MIAQIFSVGTEILLGNITDTNSKYIAQRLTEYGIDVYKMVTIGDNFQRLVKEISEALKKVDYVFISGGLGPTEDDISKEAAIKALGLENETVIDKKSKKDLEDYFSKSKKAMDVNIKQAMFPKDAIILENDIGTAPGCIIKKDRAKVILLPGPPREMSYMFENKLKLKKEAIIESRIIRIGLLGEWDMASRIDLDSQNPTISPYFDDEGGFLRITAKAANKKKAKVMLDKKEEEVRKVFKDLIISDDGKSKEETLINLLKEKNEKVSTAESITGGLIASSIVDIPGASEVLEKSFVSYSNKAKEKILNVSRETLDKFTAVSPEVCKEMLAGLDTDLKIATTGYAHKGISYVGISYKSQGIIRKFKFSADRNKVRMWTKNRALDLAILMMRGKYEDNIGI